MADPALPVTEQTTSPQSLLGERKSPLVGDEPGNTLEDGAIYVVESVAGQEGKEQTEGLEGGDVHTNEDGSHGNTATGERKKRIEYHPVKKEEIDAINKEVLGHIGLISEENYFCVLCQSRLNSIVQLERHTIANEHIRRVTSLTRDKDSAYRYCDVCHASCASDAIYEQHLGGKKHAKNVATSEYGKHQTVHILGNALDRLFYKDVIAEGDGLSLSLSESMKKFFTLEGPFIGLQYALETGTRQEPNPMYHCTLCNVVTDANNFHLHFTSSAHRLNVLKKDYPKYRSSLHDNDPGSTKGDFHSHLKVVAAEIEAKEGRKVELIKRKILRKSHPTAVAGTGGRGRGSPSVRGGSGNKAHVQSPGESSKRGRGSRGRARGQGIHSRGAANQYFPSHSKTGRGSRGSGFPNRGRGAVTVNQSHSSNQSGGFESRGFGTSRGRGTRGQGTNRGRGFVDRGGESNYFPRKRRSSAQDWNHGNFQGFSGGNAVGLGRGGPKKGRGSQRFTGANHSDHDNWEDSGNNGRGRGKRRSNSYNSELFDSSVLYDDQEEDYEDDYMYAPPQKRPLMRPRPPVQYGRTIPPPANFRNTSFGDSPRVSHMSPRHIDGLFQLPPSQSAIRWGTPSQPEQFSPSLRSPLLSTPGPSVTSPSQSSSTVDPPTLMSTLANSNIETEEDADTAFKISTALTQALLAYRLKSVSKGVESNPGSLLALLGGLQGGGGGGEGQSTDQN